MAERQETSVMVSIQEILRDAQSREEQEKVEAERRAREDEQRRLDEARRKQEEGEARLRAEEDDRQRQAGKAGAADQHIHALRMLGHRHHLWLTYGSHMVPAGVIPPERSPQKNASTQ